MNFEKPLIDYLLPPAMSLQAKDWTTKLLLCLSRH